jgi:hypothetical protein
MILKEPTCMMHGLSNLPPVSTSSSMLVPVQLVVSASTSPQTPMGHQCCTIMVPGGQVRGKRSWEPCCLPTFGDCNAERNKSVQKRSNNISPVEPTHAARFGNRRCWVHLMLQLQLRCTPRPAPSFSSNSP